MLDVFAVSPEHSDELLPYLGFREEASQLTFREGVDRVLAERLAVRSLRWTVYQKFCDDTPTAPASIPWDASGESSESACTE